MGTKKLHYEAPKLEIITMQMEGAIMVGSGSTLSSMEGVEISSSVRINSASNQDLEDLVEEILTIE